MRNNQIRSATCSCIIELYEKWYTFADFLFKTGIFPGFSQYIAGRISEAAMGGAGGAQRPVLRTERARA
jgi:hypothetical protein